MLRSIRLKNFRSLRDTGNVELRPIVLLVGANSSGKSSFLRFFPLLKQTAWSTNSSSPLLWYLDNSDVDFGDFNNAHFQDAEDPWIEVSAQVADLKNIHFSSRIVGGADGRSHVQRFTMSCIGDFIEFTATPDDAIQEFTLNGRLLPIKGDRLTQRMSGPIPRIVGSAISAFALEQRAKLLSTDLSDLLGADKFARFIDTFNYGSPEDMLKGLRRLRGAPDWQTFVAALTPESEIIREIKDLSLLRQFRWMLEDLAQTIHDYARGVRYIGPFRRSPQRFYRRSELGTNEIDRDGGNLAMFLDSLSASDREAFSAWLRQHFGFGVHTERRDAHVSMMVDTDSRRSFNVMDMGFGMSQLLPVVAQCWLASGQLRSAQISLFRDTSRSILPGTAPTLIAVEQPELHLHPHYQAQLADMFHSTVHAMDQIGQPICLCVETHSEAMLYRFGELVESGTLKREDISILLFEKRPGTDESTVRPIEFDANGVLQDWPIGFFRG